jgi:hypothetical protein
MSDWLNGQKMLGRQQNLVQILPVMDPAVITGICPFLKGDGSVSLVGNNTANIVLMMLTDTQDGGTVALP